MSEVRPEECPVCGAPLELDAEGRCRFCHHPVWGVPVVAETQPNPVRQLLGAMSTIAEEKPVGLVVARAELAAAGDRLAGAMLRACDRLRNAGLLEGGLRVELKVYEPAEMWTFNLAADFVAVLVAADNLNKAKRTTARELLVRVDAGLGTPAARSVIGNANPGPPELQDLRTAIPRRKLIRP